MHQLSRMSLLVPVLTAVQNGVARTFSSPNVALRLSRSASTLAMTNAAAVEMVRRGCETQRTPRAAVRQRPIRADHLPQRHVGGAERERRAIPVARLIEAEA